MKTLADIRHAHKGYWFYNTKKSSYSRIIGGLRKQRYIITYENPEGLTPHYTVWGVIQTNDDNDIVGLAQFSNLELAKAEIANLDERAPLHSLYNERLSRYTDSVLKD